MHMEHKRKQPRTQNPILCQANPTQSQPPGVLLSVSHRAYRKKDRSFFTPALVYQKADDQTGLDEKKSHFR